MVRHRRRRGLDIPQVIEEIDEIMATDPTGAYSAAHRGAESRERDGESGPYHSRACGVDVSVATQSQVPTIRTVQKIVESLWCMVTMFHKCSSTVAVLDLVVNMPVVDGVPISVSRHNDSKCTRSCV